MANNEKRHTGYLEGSIARLMLTKSLPMIVGIGAAMSFSFVDAFWVGKLGTAPLAAMTFTFPLDFLVMGVAFGLGNGASAEISKAFGAGDKERVKTLTRDILVLSFSVVALFLLIMYLFMDNIFYIMDAKPDVIPLIKEFMTFWIPGQFALIVPLIINSATRAIGDTKTPAAIMLVAGVINSVLNPFLIFGWYGFPQMGIAGSSLSTLIARCVTLVLAFYLVHKRDKMIAFTVPALQEFKNNIKAILKVGLPSAATQIIMPVGVAMIIKFVAQFGSVSVAAFGISSRIDMTLLVVFMALAGVIGPLVGQNLGAGNFTRIRQSMNLSYGFAFIWGTFMCLIFYFFAYPISSLVKDDKAVVAIMVSFLSINSIGIAFRGIAMINTTALNVLQKPLISSILTVSQIFVFFIPLIYLLKPTMGIKGIFWASVISGTIVAGISYFVVNHAINNLEKSRQKITPGVAEPINAEAVA